MKKQFRITVNGKAYDVVAELLDESGAPAAPVSRKTVSTSSRAAAPAAPAAPAPAAKPLAAASGDGDVPSPLAGKVVSIDIAVGANVNEGDQVITLEAMKMNTVISSPVSGTVKAINVTPGDSVEEGQSLLTIA